MKRKSDSTIFTVGDKIGINGTSPEIFKIEVEGNHCWLFYVALDGNKQVYTSSIVDAIKR